MRNKNQFFYLFLYKIFIFLILSKKISILTLKKKSFFSRVLIVGYFKEKGQTMIKKLGILFLALLVCKMTQNGFALDSLPRQLDGDASYHDRCDYSQYQNFILYLDHENQTIYLNDGSGWKIDENHPSSQEEIRNELFHWCVGDVVGFNPLPSSFGVENWQLAICNKSLGSRVFFGVHLSQSPEKGNFHEHQIATISPDENGQINVGLYNGDTWLIPNEFRDQIETWRPGDTLTLDVYQDFDINRSDPVVRDLVMLIRLPQNSNGEEVNWIPLKN